MKITPCRITRTLYLMVGAWLLVIPAASAYIDAGSSTFIFQAVVAFAMAAGVTISAFWQRLKSFFSRGSTTPAISDDEAVTPADAAEADTVSAGEVTSPDADAPSVDVHGR